MQDFCDTVFNIFIVRTSTSKSNTNSASSWSFVSANVGVRHEEH